MGFVSVCEAFGCAVLKDAAGMWPEPLAARVSERPHRLPCLGRAAGFDAPTQRLHGKVATCGETIPEQQPPLHLPMSQKFTLQLLECGWSLLGLVCEQPGMDFKQ